MAGWKYINDATTNGKLARFPHRIDAQIRMIGEKFSKAFGAVRAAGRNHHTAVGKIRFRWQFLQNRADCCQ